MAQSDKLKEFRDRAAGPGVFGFFSKTTDSSLIEASGYSGLDFVILDMEHGPVNTETLKHHLMACKASGIVSIVRVDSWNSHLIGKALDLGANGIQVPSVNNAEQVKGVIERAKFHPEGQRGVCRFVRAADYSDMDRFSYFEDANQNLVIIQLEGTAGIEAFDEIIEIPGIDILFIGPYDLSQSIGFPGQIDHPEVIKTIENLQMKARKKNIVLGTFCDTPELLKKWQKLGLGYLAYSVDIALFLEKLKSINSLRNG
ncbi:MAG: HpcH/HpaI aldolase family protein [Bacteroidia bacterium]